MQYLPAAAIQRGPQGTYVYLAQKDNSVKIQPVTIALSSGNSTGIATGLQPGDSVVVDGQDKLQDGSKIEARSPTGGSANPQGQQSQNADQAPTPGQPSQNPTAPSGKRGKRQ